MTALAQADPYGVDLAMTSGGDLVVASSGALGTVGEVGVLAQALWLRTQTEPEEVPLHEDFGVTLPVGGKMNPAGVAALVGTQLARTPQEDARFQSVKLPGSQSPVGGNANAIQLEVQAVAAGGTAFTISGLPEQASVSEVVVPEDGANALGSLGEEVEYGPSESEPTEPQPGSAQAVAEALGEAEAEL